MSGTPRTRTQQLGAQAERDASRRRMRGRIDDLRDPGLSLDCKPSRVAELKMHLEWLDGRTARFRAVKGGLGVSPTTEDYSAVEALRAACRLEHGRAVFVTIGGLAMDMPAAAECVVRAALLALDGTED